MTVPSDVADHLLNDGSLTGAPFNLTDDEVRPGPKLPISIDAAVTDPIPDRCVFIVPTGGPKDIAYKDGGARGREEFPTVQILVQSPAHDYDSGLALADAVYDSINLRAFGPYFDAQAFGRPAHLRIDEQGHHEFVFNVLLKRQRDI